MSIAMTGYALVGYDKAPWYRYAVTICNAQLAACRHSWPVGSCSLTAEI